VVAVRFLLFDVLAFLAEKYKRAILFSNRPLLYMENLKINAPCYLSLDAKVPLLGSIDDAKVGIQVISEFAMTY
jgi:hypothetical protein